MGGMACSRSAAGGCDATTTPYATGGATYGDVQWPITAGSGGLDALYFESGEPSILGKGGAGGGTVQIHVDAAVTVSGSARISANGASGTHFVNNWSGGGGAGGSVLISAGAVLGDGVIAANGGGSGDYGSYVGGGGGGRVALYAQSDLSNDLKLEAWSDTYYTSNCIGSGGTIYSDVGGHTTLRYYGTSTSPRDTVYTPHTVSERYALLSHLLLCTRCTRGSQPG